ncbi:MAG: 30S ribosomal protein S6 [Defluviitaleaceae bacterium]|nr:30S ribosomal protein S6 [Defluviitaleaceae bacterium]
MYQYELGVIVSAKLEEEAQKAELDRVQDLVVRFGGTIDKVDNWGRRKLAYPIEKQTDGIYSFITFSSEGGAPAEIENRLRILENVLRFLIIRLDQ